MAGTQKIRFIPAALAALAAAAPTAAAAQTASETEDSTTAAPLPPVPADMRGARLEFVVPVQFVLR